MATGETSTVKNYDYLYNKYNHLFIKDEYRAISMFGFECGDGWYRILEQLIDHIDSYIKHKYKDQDFNFKITQIKEKFGGLRFYFNGGDEIIHELTRYAEHMSYFTCEYCGSTTDVMRSQGWIVTACKNCIATHPTLTLPFRLDRKWVPVKND